MTQINFPTATADGQTYDAPNGVVYTYVGTPPNGYWSGTFQNEGFTTLDGRYLKLDSSNDPLTGGLIVSTGNVGIGTSSPTQLLDLESSTGARIAFTDTGARRWSIGTPEGGSTAFSIYDESGASEAVRITSSGRVGIGTDSPSQELSVSGPAISTTFVGFLISAQTTERLRIGYRTGGPDTGLTCGQIVEDTNTLHISGRDTTNGDIIFHAGSGVPERMKIDASNGNVGINVTDPSERLEIDGTVKIVKSDETAISFQDSDGNFYGFIGQSSTNDNLNINAGGTASELSLQTAGTERMRIDGDGNVCVGTTSASGLGNVNPAIALGKSPGNRLGIYGNGARWWYLHGETSNTLTVGCRISSNTADKNCITVNSTGNVGVGVGATDCKLEANGDIGIGRSAGAYTFREVVGGDERAGMHSSSVNDLRFKTASAVERVRITETGEVRLSSPGNSPSYGSNTVGIQTSGGVLIAQSNSSGHVFGRNNNGAVIFFQKGGSAKGNISISDSGVAYNESGSDIRLKKNVETWTENVLDHFKTLQPKQFNFNNEENGTVKHKGYMAQDLVDVFPEAYPITEVCISPEQEGENGEIIPCEMADRYMFNPSGMVKYLMKALQEATLRIEALEQQVSANQ